MRSLFAGQGKDDIFRMNGSAVTDLSMSACLIVESMALWLAVKLMLTGTFPAKITARFANIPPLPGGRMMPTRFFFVCLLISFDNAMAAPNSLSKVVAESSDPSNSVVDAPCFLSPAIIVSAREYCRKALFENAISSAA